MILVSDVDDKKLDCPPSLRRKVRSFVKRQGRTSRRQTVAFTNLLPVFGLSVSEKPISLTEVFQRQAPTILEIGFGMGDTLARMAVDNPHTNFVGIEVHKPGVGSLLATIDENKISNIRIFNRDAVEVLHQSIPDNSIDKIQIFFPDPWPKKRHFKRRLIQTDFIQLLSQKLKIGGELHIATDWKDYALWIENIVSPHNEFRQKENGSIYPRHTTKYETRGKTLGHDVWDMVFMRVTM